MASLQVRYNQFELIINITNFNGTYTVGNLSPYTEYNINVTAVKIIGATGESLKGEDSPVVTERTLAGGTVTNKSINISTYIFAEPIVTALLQRTENELLLNHAHFNAETFTIDMPVISTQNGPFRLAHIMLTVFSHDFVTLATYISLWLSAIM